MACKSHTFSAPIARQKPRLYLGNQVAHVGQDPSCCQVDLPAGRLDKLLVERQVLRCTLSRNAQLVQVTKERGWKGENASSLQRGPWAERLLNMGSGVKTGLVP